ncbi:MAG: hypothetical protein R3A79_00870 [Nannocystaceae bacterium]
MATPTEAIEMVGDVIRPWRCESHGRRLSRRAQALEMVGDVIRPWRCESLVRRLRRRAQAPGRRRRGPLAARVARSTGA